MAGQYGYFALRAEEKVPAAIARFGEEVTRLLGVLDRRLNDHPWLAGEHYSIADIASYSWTKAVLGALAKAEPIANRAFPPSRRGCWPWTRARPSSGAWPCHRFRKTRPPGKIGLALAFSAFLRRYSSLEGADHDPDPLLPRPARHRRQGLRLPVRARLQHPRRPAVRRPGDRSVLHARGVRRRRWRQPHDAPCAEFGDPGRALQDEVDPARPRRALSRVCCWLASSTIAWPICSIAGASASCRWTSSASSPTTRPRPTSSTDRRPALPPHAGDQGDQAEQEADLGSDPGHADRSRRARALHADPVGRPVGQAAPAAASISTTRSCRASRAPSPITRPMRAA
jgi:hypothetical protein